MTTLYELHIEIATYYGRRSQVEEHATQRLERLNTLVPQEVTLWRGVFGTDAGAYAFATPFRNRVDFEAARQQSEADAEMQRIEAEGLALSNAFPSHNLLSLIHGSFDSTPPAIGGVASVVWANLVLKEYAAAVGWAYEITDLAEAATGIRGVLMLDQHDGYGRVTWMSVADDMAAMDHTETTLRENQAYVESTMRGAGLCEQGSGKMTLWSRIA